MWHTRKLVSNYWKTKSQSQLGLELYFYYFFQTLPTQRRIRRTPDSRRRSGMAWRTSWPVATLWILSGTSIQNKRISTLSGLICPTLVQRMWDGDWTTSWYQDESSIRWWTTRYETRSMDRTIVRLWDSLICKGREFLYSPTLILLWHFCIIMIIIVWFY